MLKAKDLCQFTMILKRVGFSLFLISLHELQMIDQFIRNKAKLEGKSSKVVYD
jgi:hypothetical protein